MGYVKFIDAVDFKAAEVDPKVKDFYANAQAQGNVQPLNIRIAATHAGKVTRNNGFYLPHKMREGAPSFTKHYAKPIQVHHEDKADPIGRVKAATYVDISGNMRDSFDGKTWKDSARSMTRIFDGFVRGTLSEREILDVANKYFIQDNSLAENPDYEGLGYVELIAQITDPNAIQRIIDGRYLTGSVGASTDQAVCSVCKQDWAEEGQCDHKPGKVYDEVRCVLIAGNLNYEEYSFVNKPADRHSKVIEVNVNGVKDFVKLDQQAEETIKDSIPEISLVADYSCKEERQMAVQDNEKTPEVVPATAPAPEAVPAEPAPAEVPIKDEVQVLKDFYGDEFDAVVGTDDPWGLDYAKMLYGLYEDAAEDQKEAVKKEIMDAKLHAAERNKLSGKTFCGPNRSYPVNDCSHAKAAVRMAPHAGSGASAIAACARRKAARMGCPIGDGEKKTKDSYDVKKAGKFGAAWFDRYEDKDLLKMELGLKEALEERGLGCTECAELADDTRVKELEAQLAEAKSHKVVDLMDIENLNRAIADYAAEVRATHLRHITDLRVLKGDKATLDGVTTELKDKTGPEIRGMLKDLSEKIDMQKIADTLNSGLASKPTEIVADPTQSIVDKEHDVVPPEAQDSKTAVVDEMLAKQIRVQYMNIMYQKGQDIADKWIEDCKSQGIVPSDWSIRG
jgi:hypothetical protein